MADGRVTVLRGDARHLPLDDATVDAIVTDPPYELGFMGKRWDATGVAYDPATWREAYRALRPGGHLLAFGGTRTWHRLAVAIEDAGFELRDSIAWLYGSGFPKSLDVSKAIDKAAGAEREVVGVAVYGDGHIQRSAESIGYGGCDPEADRRSVTAPATDDARRWQGWGTALKPGFEPIVVARKPLAGTVAANVLAHGCGGINIDATRVPAVVGDYAHPGNDLGRRDDEASWRFHKRQVQPHTAGRWPTNVVLSHPPLVDGDGQVVGDACADGCVEGCPVAELDAQSGTRQAGAAPAKRAGMGYHGGASGTNGTRVEFDTGGASRFFPVFRYQAKAPTKERPKVDGVAHPTVKPLALTRWMVRLVTPPDGLVLDPFAGSGTTVEAAIAEGFRVVGIEYEAAYLPLIQARLDRQLVTAKE